MSRQARQEINQSAIHSRRTRQRMKDGFHLARKEPNNRPINGHSKWSASKLLKPFPPWKEEYEMLKAGCTFPSTPMACQVHPELVSSILISSNFNPHRRMALVPDQTLTEMLAGLESEN
jgi:hypothetical protein